jgi:putative tryptophan/tyrosine transport system substrate-binding protein
MRRRTFIAGLGYAAAAWPLAARAQQGERIRRIGYLTGLADDRLRYPNYSAIMRSALNTFVQGLQQLGWTVGRNVQIEERYDSLNRDLYRKYAQVAEAPDVILVSGAGMLGELQQATRTIPIVFVDTTDPVSGGFVRSLARPGGNTTGFFNFEYSLAGKWPELLKEIAPAITRVAALRDPSVFSGGAQLGVIQAVAPFFGMEVTPIDVRNVGEMERDIAEFARKSNSGLIVTASFRTGQIHRRAIVALAAHRLPAVYFSRPSVVDGGLISYGPDYVEPYRLAAGYVDRILKGERVALAA